MWLKGCPRCFRGDVVLKQDFYGWMVQCLQCGYVRDVSDSEAAEMARQGGNEKEDAQALDKSA